jgi:nitrate/TMAO reductase-like tetraheme cytochrome c subunit
MTADEHKQDTTATTGAPAAPPTPRWWRWIGLRRRPGKRFAVVPTFWGWLVLVGFVGFLGTVGFAEYSMQPDFCRSCHLMEPYYQAWHNSTHRDVPCGDCHFEPGWQHTIKGKWEASSQAVKYITGTFGSKPHAEVRDSSCLREGCHSHRLLEGKTQWTVDSSRGVPITIRFDHTPHLQEMRRGKNLRCVSCHSQMVQGQHITVTLDTCFLCHMKGVQHGRNDQTIGGCRSCHDAPKGEIHLATGVFNHGQYIERGVACENCHADVLQGDGDVPKQVCWNCHNQPAHLARYNDTAFVHQNHVSDHKVECSSCHVQIVHHLDANSITAGLVKESHGITDAGTCGQCHDGTHRGPLDLYRGTGGRGVPDMPSPMFRAQVDCLACHQQRQWTGEVASVTGQTYVAAQQACDGCHGQKYSEMLQQWRDTVDMNLLSAQEAFDNASKRLTDAKLAPDKLLPLQRLLDDADHNIRFVKLGHGLHNVIYATALLSVARDNCAAIVRVLDGGSISEPQEDFKS